MRAPGWIVPLLVVACAGGGAAASRLLVAPSLTEAYAAPAPGAATRTSVFVVEGVKCVDTAARAAGQLRGLAGVYGVEAFAPRARLEVAYDPARTDAAAIRDALESAVHDTVTGEYRFGLFTVVEVDGRKIEPADASESESE